MDILITNWLERKGYFQYASAETVEPRGKKLLFLITFKGKKLPVSVAVFASQSMHV
jgi:hypothetical protein